MGDKAEGTPINGCSASLSSGAYTVKTTIANHKVESGVQVKVMALLKKDGIVVKSAASEVTIAEVGKTEISLILNFLIHQRGMSFTFLKKIGERL